MNSPLLEKSMDFATQIVLFYEEFSKSKKERKPLLEKYNKYLNSYKK